MQVYLLDLHASYIVVLTAPQTGWNILLRMSFHNIQRSVPIFCSRQRPPFILARISDPVKSFMILLKDGTGHHFVLFGITQTIQQSLSKESQKHPQVDTTARTSISYTGTCFMAPLVRIYVLWGGASSLCPVCLLAPESKWTGHLDTEHEKGGN